MEKKVNSGNGVQDTVAKKPVPSYEVFSGWVRNDMNACHAMLSIILTSKEVFDQVATAVYQSALVEEQKRQDLEVIEADEAKK